jgi:dTDP-4-amino-4,6-dideoxygalactose transaminase
MAAMLLNIAPGDEVLVPAFSFVSTANAFATRGATPVLVDVRPDTLNIDERRVGEAVGPRTRAIVVMHYGGIGCALDELMGLAAERGIAVVEDNAHGLFGAYRGRGLGSFGSLAALSFHHTKNFSCGEGGALVVNDSGLIARAEILREKGTDRGRFLRGEADKYSWVDLGSSFLPADLLAAVLLAQLEHREEVQASRGRSWHRYRDSLADWAAANGVGLPAVPRECQPAFHLFHLLMPTAAEQQRMIDHLRGRGVQAAFHYPPLHLSEMGRRFGGAAGQHPCAESVSAGLVRLPLYPTLSEGEQDRVVEAVLALPL